MDLSAYAIDGVVPSRVERPASAEEVGAVVAAADRDRTAVERATVGGTIASAATGPSRLRHQHVRDWVIGCEAVLGDGTRARAGGRVVKNVTGYDLTRLYSGSFGTLAALVELSLKLVAIDERAVVLSLRGGRAHLVALSAELRAALPLDALVLATGDAAGDATLTVRLAGSGAAVERLRRELMRRGAFAEVGDAAWEDLVALPARYAHIARAALPPGRETEALAGDGVAHIGTGSTFVLGERTNAELAALRASCEKDGGALIVERTSEAQRKALGTWGTPRIPSDVARRLKERFDPHAVLAPGRVPL